MPMFVTIIWHNVQVFTSHTLNNVLFSPVGCGRARILHTSANRAEADGRDRFDPIVAYNGSLEEDDFRLKLKLFGRRLRLSRPVPPGFTRIVTARLLGSDNSCGLVNGEEKSLPL